MKTDKGKGKKHCGAACKVCNKSNKIVTEWRIVLTMEDGSHVDFNINNDRITGAIDSFISDAYDTEWSS